MMDGWDVGMGSGWWVLMTVFWVALLGGLVWAVIQLFPGRSPDAVQQEPATAILERRLAQGEIDPDTYDLLRGKLRSGAKGVS